jgi:hypothetical protein
VLWLHPGNGRSPARWVLNAQFANDELATTSNEFIAFGDLTHAF